MPFNTNNKIQLVDGSGDPVVLGTGAVTTETLRVTVATDDPHWGTVGTAAASDGTAHGQLRFIANSVNGISSLSSNISAYTNSTSQQLGYMSSFTGAEYAEGDGGVLANGVRNDALATLVSVDHDHAPFQVNAIGGLYVTGSEVENAAVQSEPLLMGGRYDSSARTLGNGDAGAVALNASGHVIMDVVDGGQLDTIIDTLETTLTAIETDQAAIEALLITIDSDTNATQGYLSNLSGTQYVDDANWTDGSSKHLLVGGLYQSSMQSVTDGDVAPFQIDANGVLKVAHAVTGGADGVTVVTTAGTDVVLGGDVACKKIDIQAQTDNTGLIAVGFTGVDATEATGTGVILYAGDTYSLEVNNLNLIYLDSTVSGEGVRYTYWT